jgi:hypothetical protein
MKIIKLDESEFVGVQKYRFTYFMVFRTKFEDYELVKTCKVIPNGEGDNQIWAIDPWGKISKSPTGYTAKTNSKKRLAMG